MSRCAPGASGRRARARAPRARRPTPARSRRARRRGRRRPTRHSADVPPVEVDERASPRPALERADGADEDHVVADVEPLRRSRRGSSRPRPRAAAARPPRDRDPVPLHERRHAPREVLREVRLVAGEDRHAPLPRLVEHLEDRRRPAPIEIETSGGSSDTETSDETVSPAFRPPTRRRRPTRPAGQRRKELPLLLRHATSTGDVPAQPLSRVVQVRTCARLAPRTLEFGRQSCVVQARDREVALARRSPCRTRRAPGPATSRRA